MNIIDNIIDKQQFIAPNTINIYNLVLDQEDVLVSIHDNNIDVKSSYNLTDSQKYRLSLVLPYISRFLLEHPIKHINFVFSVGDCLNKQYDNIPVICFSKKKYYSGILIPNIDFFTGAMHSFLTDSDNDIPYDYKSNTSIFVGSSTGQFASNTRVIYGKKCLDNNITKHQCIINNLCQNDFDTWKDEYPWIIKLIGKSQSIKNQLTNKIVVNIDGNTVCWSRLYWQMNSNSIPVYINRSQTDIQFFDYVNTGFGYIDCSLESSIETLNQILDTYSAAELNNIIDEGKNFCNKCFFDYKKDPQSFLQSAINKTFLRIIS